VHGGRAAAALQVTSGSPGAFAVTIVLTQGGLPLPNLTVEVVVKR
jgi:hypothetical protein